MDQTTGIKNDSFWFYWQYGDTKKMMFLCVALSLAMAIYFAYRGLNRTGMVFALLWSTYAFEQVLQTSIPWFVAHGSIINVAGGLLVVGAVGIRQVSLKKLLAQRDPILWLYVALFIYAAISTQWSFDSRAWSRVKSALPYFLAVGILSPLCINSWKDLEDTRKVMIIFGGVVMIAASLGSRLESHGSRSLQLAAGAVNARGKQAISNPLAIASFAGSVATFSFLYLLSTKKATERLYCLTAMFAGAIAMANSGSRGNIIAVGGSMLIGVYLLRKQISANARLTAVALMVVVVSLGVWRVASDRRMLERWSVEKTTEAIEGRQTLASELLADYQDRPSYWVAGLGSSASYHLVGFYVHMVQVEVLCELGIIGFSMYAAICWLTFRNCFALIKLSRGSPEKTSIAVALSCCSLAVFITHAKSSTFLATPDWYALNIVMSTFVRNHKVLQPKRYLMMPPNWAGNPPVAVK